MQYPKLKVNFDDPSDNQALMVGLVLFGSIGVLLIAALIFSIMTA